MAAILVDDTLNGVPSMGERLRTMLCVAELILQAAITSGYSSSDSGGSSDTSNGPVQRWTAKRAVIGVEGGVNRSKMIGKAWTWSKCTGRALVLGGSGVSGAYVAEDRTPANLPTVWCRFVGIRTRGCVRGRLQHGVGCKKTSGHRGPNV